VGLKLNETFQILDYAHDINIMGDNIDITNKSIQNLMSDIRVVGIEIILEGTKYMLKYAVFWDVTPCGSCNNRRFGGT
jgi:hypothetical protein